MIRTLFFVVAVVLVFSERVLGIEQDDRLDRFDQVNEFEQGLAELDQQRLDQFDQLDELDQQLDQHDDDDDDNELDQEQFDQKQLDQLDQQLDQHDDDDDQLDEEKDEQIGYEQDALQLDDISLDDINNTYPDHDPSGFNRTWTKVARNALIGNQIGLSIGGYLYQPVVFTIFYKKDKTGLVSYSSLLNQIDALNSAFSGADARMARYSQASDAKIRFRLAGIRFVQNDDYQHMCTLIDRTIKLKKLYGMDPARYLNVYLCNVSSRLGLAWYPWDSFLGLPATENSYANSIYLHYALLPGNSYRGGVWKKGKILVHETGHIYGARHLYDGGCDQSDASSDQIDDTPRQVGNPLTGSCAALNKLNSCPKLPGKDDSSNYMGATPDACRNHFTPGQVNYMWRTIRAYKPTLMTQPSSNCFAAIDSTDKSPDLQPCLGPAVASGGRRMKCATDPTNSAVWAWACCPGSDGSWDGVACARGVPNFMLKF